MLGRDAGDQAAGGGNSSQPRILSLCIPSNGTISTVKRREFAMKMRWFLLVSGFFTALVFSDGSASSQTVVTFDNLAYPTNGINSNGVFVPNGYQGLNWTNFAI